MQSETGFAAALKNHNEHIIGCMFGYLEANEICFQICFVEQKPNFPEISLEKVFYSYEEAIIDRFNPDFISIRISPNALDMEDCFKKLGFYTQKIGDQVYMLKNLRGNLLSHSLRKIKSFFNGKSPFSVIDYIYYRG